MSAERYYWRSDPASDPVQLPRDWTRIGDSSDRAGSTSRPRTGRLRRLLMKSDAADAYFEAERQSRIALRAHLQVSALRAAEAPTRTVTIQHVQDTKQTINEDPVLVMTVDVDERRIEMIALVPRVAVPRPGEDVEVIKSGSDLLYVGPTAVH